MTAFQAYETRQAVTAAQMANAQALEAVRPWVGMSGPIVMTKVTDGQDQQIEYTTKVKNFGGSPAFNVIPIVNFVMGERGTDIRPQIEDACKHVENDLLPLKVGEMVFPGDEYSFPTEETPSRSLPKLSTNSSDPVYVFPGCIVYLTSDGKIHHTKICQWTDKYNYKVGAKLSSCSRQSAD